MSLTTRRTTRRLTIDAPADLIFAVLQDSSHRPLLDGLTVYSERVSGDDDGHEIRTSAVVNGALNSGHCRRVFNAAGHRVEFRQLDLDQPSVQMGGHWAILQADDSAEVTLTHEFEVEEELELIHGTIDD